MPGSGNKGDRGDGTSGGFGGGGFGGGGLGGGGVGRDTISAYGGQWGRMGNFRGDPGLGGGGAVGFSGIANLAQALAAQRQNPGLARMSGLDDALASGRFGVPTGVARAQRQADPTPAAAPPATPKIAPAPQITVAPPPSPGFWATPTKWARNPDAWAEPTIVGRRPAQPNIGYAGYNRINGDTYSNLGEFGPGMGTGTGFVGTGFQGTTGRDNPAVGPGGRPGGTRGPGGGRGGGIGGGLY